MKKLTQIRAGKQIFVDTNIALLTSHFWQGKPWTPHSKASLGLLPPHQK